MHRLIRAEKWQKLPALESEYSCAFAQLKTEITAGDIDADDFLDDISVKKIASYPTNLSKMKKENFDALVEHGYQVTKLSLSKITS